LLVTVNNRLILEIEIVHDLSCHPIHVYITFPVLNDKLVACVLGLLPARLPRSHSLQCLCT